VDGSIGSIDIAGSAEPPVTPAEAYVQRLGPQLRKIAIAMKTLWPDGRVPEILGVRERRTRVQEHMMKRGLVFDEVPKERTFRTFYRETLPQLIALGYFQPQA
jgi:hypothetical protein